MTATYLDPTTYPDPNQPRPRRIYRPGPLPPAAPQVTDPLSDRNLLVVGMHYGSASGATGAWAQSLAEHLASRARSVTVISGLPHDASGGVDPHYAGLKHLVQPPANGAGPLVVRRGHHVPARWTAAGRARYEAGFAIRAATTRLRYRPDLVIGVTPAPGGAAAAARIAARYRAPLVILAQAVQSRPETPLAGPLAALPRRMERRAFTRAARIAVTGQGPGAAVAALGVPRARITQLPGLLTRLFPTAILQRSGRATDAVDQLLDGLLPPRL